MGGVGSSSAFHSQLPTITPRKSDRGVKSVEQMMDILVDDIMRYESLAEMEEIMALDTLFHADEVENTATATGNVLELLEVTPSDVHVQGLVETEEVLPQVSDTERNTRYKPVTLEDTDQFLVDNRNTNTTCKTNSDLRMFYDWRRSNGELRLIDDVPAGDLDALQSPFYIGIS